jgi:hypothetical protein
MSSDEPPPISAVRQGNIHRHFGLMFRPWTANGSRPEYSLTADAGAAGAGAGMFAYKPQQLFAPSGVENAQMLRDVSLGCLVGASEPFVLPVAPAHFSAPHRQGMFAFNPSLVRHRGGYMVSYRVDYQNGCVVQKKGMRTQYMARSGNRHSCVLRTDAALSPIGPARVLDACGRIVSEDSASDLDAGTHVVDVRLARGPVAVARSSAAESARGSSDEPFEHEPIWLTYLPMSQFYHTVSGHCKVCCMQCDKNTHVATLATYRGPKHAGGWAVSIRAPAPLCEGKLSGRNHALFAGSDGAMRLQAWLHPKVVVSTVPPAPSSADPKPQGRVELSETPSNLRFKAGADAAARCAHLRISGTTSLVRVHARGREALLGIGHLHHAREPNRTLGILKDLAQIRQGIAYFGSHYMHFFYLLEPEPPHALVAHSSEWCLPHSEAVRSCEVVQFVSGLELAHGDAELILMYGVNDCEAKVARLQLETALGTLEWLD